MAAEPFPAEMDSPTSSGLTARKGAVVMPAAGLEAGAVSGLPICPIEFSTCTGRLLIAAVLTARVSNQRASGSH